MEKLIKKYIIFIGLIVAVIALGFYLVIPNISNYFSEQSSIKTKKEKINDLKKNIESAKIAKAKTERKKEEPVITKLIYEPEYKTADSGINFNGMLETILELAKQAGLKVKTIEFKNIPESDLVIQNHASEYDATLLDAQFIGNYTQFQSFMREIYRHQYLIGINNFKIVPYEYNKKILIIDMTLSLYMKK